MMNSNEGLSSIDALLLLRKMDEEDQQPKSNKVTEGQSFSLDNQTSRDAARKVLDATDVNEVELEVIDVNADVVDHLASKESYIGQAILRCNRCKANRFINMDNLIQSEENSDLYNVEDECPHCHGDGGYELIGQVGKANEAEFDNDEASEIQDDPKLDGEEVDNSDADSEEVDHTFDSDAQDFDTFASTTDTEDESEADSTSGDEEEELEKVDSGEDTVEADDDMDFDFDFDDEDSEETPEESPKKESEQNAEEKETKSKDETKDEAFQRIKNNLSHKVIKEQLQKRIAQRRAALRETLRRPTRTRSGRAMQIQHTRRASIKSSTIR